MTPPGMDVHPGEVGVGRVLKTTRHQCFTLFYPTGARTSATTSDERSHRAALLTQGQETPTHARLSFFAASLLHTRDRHERLLSTVQMHTPAPRTLAVAALVVVVKAPMLLLHYMSMTFFLQ